MKHISHLAGPAGQDDEALSWFAALQRARRTDDRHLEDRAERELEHMGYVVRLIRPIRVRTCGQGEGGR